MVEWLPTITCSECNETKQVVDLLDEGIDPETKNPFRIVKMDCGHIEKFQRVTKELTLRWQILEAEKEIQKEIDRNYSSNREEINNILEESKNDAVKTKRIPDSKLEKLKKFERIYNLALPWIRLIIDLILKGD